MQRVGEVTVAHGPLLTGRAGDRAGPGVVLACLRVGVPLRVVSELGEHPGTEDIPQATQYPAGSTGCPYRASCTRLPMAFLMSER
jgi:hypothetical protein